MRIVMPLFDFCNESGKEFMFSGNKYALRSFDATNEIPKIELFSIQDIKLMEMESWALVAEADNLDNYKEEVNTLLLSFKIYKRSRIFIKYRLCKEDKFKCFRINNDMKLVTPDESTPIVTLDDLNIINNGFSKLLKMDAVSCRTHNSVYFMYRGFCSDKMIDSFLFLMCAVESLFSDENRSGATKTICSRVSKFLGCKQGYDYSEIERLYDLRSRIVHGKIVVEDEIKGNLKTLYKLEDVLIECVKKMLDDEIYQIYADVNDKENYFKSL